MRALVFGLVAAEAVALHYSTTNWYLSQQYVNGQSSGCGSSGPVESWSAKSFGLCELNVREGTYSISSITSGTDVSTQGYGSDSTCTTGVGAPKLSQIPSNQLGCQTSSIRASTEVFSVVVPASTASYGLPIAPFTGVGFFSTLDSTCSDFSQVTGITLVNSQTVPTCYSATFFGGTTAPSYTVSCSTPASPQLILYQNSANCSGNGVPMTASNAPTVYPTLSAVLASPPCTNRNGLYTKPLFCVDTAVAITPSRLNFPTPRPSLPPTPSARPTRVPTPTPSLSPAPTATAIQSDTQALCALYNTFDAKLRATKLGTWCSAGATACNPASTAATKSAWAGVTCEWVHTCADTNCNLDHKLRVVSLSLKAISPVSLGGRLPSQLGDLNGLTALQLAGLGLTGALPPQIAALERLAVLDVGSNSLSGRLPTVLGLLVNLETLDLQQNAFTGPLPSQLSALTGLQTLNLLKNLLQGPVPSWIGDKLSSLTLLNLGSNAFQGPIPTSLCSLGKATAITVSANAKLDCYPPCLSSFASFGHDGTQAQCSPPTAKPTPAPVTASPTSLRPPTTSAATTDASTSSAGSGSSLSAGGIAGVTIALIVLFCGLFYVYRQVRATEADLPSNKEEDYSGARNPMAALGLGWGGGAGGRGGGGGGGGSEDIFGRVVSTHKDSIPPAGVQQYYYGRKDSIPEPASFSAESSSGRAGGPNLSLSGNRDSIPSPTVEHARSKSGGRLNPFTTDQSF